MKENAFSLIIVEKNYSLKMRSVIGDFSSSGELKWL